MGMTYRREIDGLRAVAVAAVVLYHAGVGPVSGFLGVDVFFVISGYLITGLLLREHALQGRIDLGAFYARRMRRILPATFVMIAVVLLAAPALLGSASVLAVERSAVAAVVFLANHFFELETGGYFHADAARMPLLHLWSLAVEEQFYLVWPFLLALLLRFRVNVAWSLGAAVLASFALSEWLLLSRPEAAFFMMPARFWEIGVGGLIAMLPQVPRRGLVAGAGFVLVIAACFTPVEHFPGAGALPVVVGTMLLLAHVHGGGRIGFLASGPMVGLGLVSFSLYLWHWPLLAFYRSTVVGSGDLATKLVLCAFALVLAFASHRAIEQPFRRRAGPAWRTLGAATAACLMLGGSASLLAEKGKVAAATPATSAAARAAADHDVLFANRCEYGSMDENLSFPKASCRPDAGARLVLWGDSMASAWEPMVVQLDARASAFVRSGCPPLLGYRVVFRAHVVASRCADFNDRVAAAIQGDTLVMAARWGMYSDIDASLARTLARVSPRFRHVVLVGVTPEMKDSVPHCLDLLRPEDCALTRGEFDARRRPIKDELLRLAARYPNVSYLDPTEFFCTAITCAISRDGYSLYTDSHHVSATAARAFAAHIGKL